MVVDQILMFFLVKIRVLVGEMLGFPSLRPGIAGVLWDSLSVHHDHPPRNGVFRGIELN